MRTPFRTASATPRTSLLLANVLALSLAACGGHGGHHGSRSKTGNMRLSVVWPQDTTNSRVIPTTAQSLLVRVFSGATVIDSQVVTRPTTSAMFSELPVGSFTVDVSAYSNGDGSGSMVAWASLPTTIVADGTATVSVNLASTIDHLDISPSTATVSVLGGGLITVTGRDTNNNAVLVSPSSLTFGSSNPSVIAVDSSGHLTAGSSTGTATITVSEADSGKSASVSVSVVPSVSVTPATKAMSVRDTQTFVATVLGTGNTAVTWSVQEGAAGGSVTSGGVYTAPAAKGTYHVVATSVADPTQTAVATVTVQSGTLNVNVH